MGERAKHNTLNHQQIFVMGEWFKKNKSTLRSNQTGQTEAAEMATAALGFIVNVNNIARAFGDHDKAIIRFQWPRAGPKQRATSEHNARQQIIIQAIETLKKEMGIKFPNELEVLWTGLVEDEL